MNRTGEGKTDDGPIDDQFVAYLDGELDAEAQDQVERQLASDGWCRDRVRDLQQAWDLLDCLPNAQTDRSFTETTVELVAEKASEEVSTQQRAIVRQRRKGWVLRGACLVVALTLGYVATSTRSTMYQDRLLRDLPIIGSLDLYRHVPSVEFLHRLDRDGLFASDEVEEDSALEADHLFTHFDLESLRRRASELSPVEKTQLQRDRERFDSYAPDVQNRMRQVHAGVIADPDAVRLLQVMAQYHEWLKSLRSGQRTQLLELPPDPRLTSIAEIKRRQDAQRFHLVAKQVTESDFKAIDEWFKDFYARNQEEYLKGLSDEERRDWERRPWWDQRRMMMERLPEPNDQEMEKLAEQLSPDAGRALRSTTDRSEQMRLVGGWMAAARFSRRRQPVGDEELERVFRELDPAKREELLRLPSEEFKHRLRREYFMLRFRRGGPGDRSRFWGPPPPGPRPGRPMSLRPEGERGPGRGRDSRGPRDHRGVRDR